MSESNDGIIISGGSVNTGAMVAGRGARVHMGVNQSLTENRLDDPEIAQRVAALETSLDDNAAALADHAAALTQLHALLGELRHPEPRSSRVEEILGTLRESVGSVAAVLGNVASLEHALARLL